ncbi:MAG TPA: Rv2578c family radical SAM protein [Pseudonocardiaceae bacterium]|nr:Rv2578c family radical SAM protein [Pseudonocardiaceae bacterium]
MRWDNLTLSDGSAQDALFGAGDVITRTFDTPEFRGMMFYEVRARSVVNKVPGGSRMPFEWTVNPYRGCSHACVYCFARRTHEYLDLDAGIDFDSKIVVKVNAPELVRKELTSPRWVGDHIAMGTNVDPYQRVEGRYRLMPGILEALRDVRNPFSILTKGTLVLRDLDLLREAAEVTDVSVNVSVGCFDQTLWRQVEPGTPAPRARLGVCRALTDAGIGCGVLMAPILPYLSDSPSRLETTVRAIAEAGARRVTPIVLHLRPGAREWYLSWLEREHPELVTRYHELYGRGAYAPKAYQRSVCDQVAELARRYGVGNPTPGQARRRPVRRTAVRAGPLPGSASARFSHDRTSAEAEQLTLL